MQTIVYQTPVVNLVALDESCRRELGDAFVGISMGNGAVTVYLREDADKPSLTRTRNLLADHHPEQLTTEQAKRAEASQQLAVWRKAYETPLTVADYPTDDQTLQTLIARLAWLEAEVRALRG